MSWDNQIRLALLVVAPAMIWLVGFGGNQKSYPDPKESEAP